MGPKGETGDSAGDGYNGKFYVFYFRSKKTLSNIHSILKVLREDKAIRESPGHDSVSEYLNI